MKILLIDDDRGDRAQLARQLGKSTLAAELTHATSVAAAITSMEAERPDCVLLDYQIPGIEELEGLDSLRALDKFLPIVLVTGYGDELLAARAINAGADDYIPKHELTPQTIEHAVNNAIEKASLRRSLAEHQHELESFAYMLSHDLRAPLNHIQTFSDMITEALEEKHYDDLADYAGFMSKAAANVNRLVRLLTDFLSHDTQQITLEALDLNLLVSDVKDIILLENPNAALTVETLPTVTSNDQLLRQLFQNVLGNAVKYNRGETPTISVSCISTGQQHEICVQDNGIGMSADELKDIFKPFVRLHGDGEFPGSGLGLAICAKNAARLGGNIRAESEAGVGSRFYINLPVA